MNPQTIDWKLIFSAAGILAAFVTSVVTFDRRINENKAEIQAVKQLMVEREAVSREYRSNLDRRFDKLDSKLDQLIEKGHGE